MATIFSGVRRQQQRQEDRGTIFSGIRRTVPIEEPEPAAEVAPASDPRRLLREQDTTRGLEILEQARRAAEIKRQAEAEGVPTIGPATGREVPLEAGPQGIRSFRELMRFATSGASHLPLPELVDPQSSLGQFVISVDDPFADLPKPQGAGQVAARVAGTILPFLLPARGAQPIASAAAGAVARRGAGRLAQRVAAEAAREAVITPVVAAPGRIREVAEGEATPAQAAGEVAVLTGLGAAGGAAAPLVGAGLQAAARSRAGRAVARVGEQALQRLRELRNRYLPRTRPVVEQVERILTEPEPKVRSVPAAGATEPAPAADPRRQRLEEAHRRLKSWTDEWVNGWAEQLARAERERVQRLADLYDSIRAEGGIRIGPEDTFYTEYTQAVSANARRLLSRRSGATQVSRGGKTIDEFATDLGYESVSGFIDDLRLISQNFDAITKKGRARPLDTEAFRDRAVRDLEELDPDFARAMGMVEELERRLGLREDVAEAAAEPLVATAGVQAAAGPAPTPRRLPVQIQSAIAEAQARPDEIVRGLQQALGVPIRVGRMGPVGREVRGIFKVKPEVIRTREAFDLETIAHEIGHFLDKRFRLTQKQYQAELLALGQATSRKGYSTAQKMQEGVAEFVRLYLTNPEQAARRAPKFHQAFEAVVQEVPDVDAALQLARRQIEAWQSSPAKARIAAFISTDSGRPRRLTMDQLSTMFVDELRPLQKAVDAMRGGRKLRPQEDPFTLAWLARGAARKVQQALEDGIFDSSGRRLAPGLRQILEPVRDRLDDFRVYAVARRARELMRRTTKVERRVPDPSRPSGFDVIEEEVPAIRLPFDPDDVDAALRELDSPEFQQVFDALRQFQDTVLEMLVDAGVYSADDVSRMRLLNMDYVPFYRVFEEGQNISTGFGGRGYANLTQPIRGIRGSTRVIIDPIESIIKNTTVFMQLAERNRVGRSLLRLARSVEGAGAIVEELPTPARPTRVQLKELSQSIRKALNVDLEDFGLKFDDLLDLSQKADIWRPAGPARRENILTVFDNGKPVYLQVDPELYRALTAMDAETSNFLIRMLSVPTRLLRRGATLSLGFILRNPIRDQFMAFIQSKYGYLPPVDFVRGLFHVLRRDNMYQRWVASGGAMSTLNSLDRQYLRGTMNRLLRDERSFAAWLDRLNPIDVLARASEVMEEATRVGEFARGIRAGADPMEAAIASRDITIDFGRKGTQGKIINQVTAFWNARIQGWNKLLREFRARPAQMTGRAVAAITLPTVALYAVNRNNPAYWEIPQWQRDLFWHIPVGDGRFLKIPRPFELGIIFGALPERILAWIDQQDPEALSRDLHTLIGREVEGVSPFEFTGLWPLFEVQSNYSRFLDRPIVPESEQRLPPELQFGPHQTMAARRIGAALGVSPRQVEHVVRGVGGNLPMEALRAIDPLLGGAPRPARGIAERIPGVASFVAEPFEQSESLNRFYRHLSELETEYFGARATGQAFTRQAELRRLRRARERLTDLRDQRNRILESRDMTPQQKAERLQQINLAMVNVARRALGQEAVR